jgi:hypothetical protein
VRSNGWCSWVGGWVSGGGPSSPANISIQRQGTDTNGDPFYVTGGWVAQDCFGSDGPCSSPDFSTFQDAVPPAGGTVTSTFITASPYGPWNSCCGVIGDAFGEGSGPDRRAHAIYGPNEDGEEDTCVVPPGYPAWWCSADSGGSYFLDWKCYPPEEIV